MNALLEYQDNNKSVMDELSISLPWKSSEPDVDIQAIERFLKNGPSITELEIYVSQHALLDKSCLIAQAKSLESLVLCTGGAHPAKTYGVDDMKAIL
jgi:hypothetical protein